MAYIFQPDYNPPTIMEQVYEYVTNNPNCTNAQIRGALGIGMSTTSGTLRRLREMGDVMRVGNNHKYATWKVGHDPIAVQKEVMLSTPQQSTVTTWEPSTLRDPMIDLLFGRAA